MDKISDPAVIAWDQHLAGCQECQKAAKGPSIQFRYCKVGMPLIAKAAPILDSI
jgi:hypothetical protein